MILIFSDIMYEIRLKSLVTKTKLCFIIFEDNQISKIAYNKKANHHDELKRYFLWSYEDLFQTMLIKWSLINEI